MIDLSVLYPPFAQKVLQLRANCAALGCTYNITSGLRTHAEQDGLYAIGRTTGKPGSYVTKAKGGQSYHNFGVAVDYARIVMGKTVWAKSDYTVLGQEAVKLGLEWGGGWMSFVDLPHVQLRVKLGTLQVAYSAGGLPNVFKVLDAMAPKPVSYGDYSDIMPVVK